MKYLNEKGKFLNRKKLQKYKEDDYMIEPNENDSQTNELVDTKQDPQF